MQSIQLKHTVHWEFTISNLGPQEPLWAQTQLFRPEGTQSCASHGTWAPAQLHFPALTHILGPILAAWDTICSLLFSLIQSLWPNHTWRKSQPSSPLTMSLQAHPSGLITWTQGDAGLPLWLSW